MQIEVQARETAFQCQVAGRHHHLGQTRLLKGFAVVLSVERTTDHQGVQALFRGLGGGHFCHHFTILHHINPIAEVE
ncbi:hypothetical protein D3C87_1567740 [compost metagenome]